MAWYSWTFMAKERGLYGRSAAYRRKALREARPIAESATKSRRGRDRGEAARPGRRRDAPGLREGPESGRQVKRRGEHSAEVSRAPIHGFARTACMRRKRSRLSWSRIWTRRVVQRWKRTKPKRTMPVVRCATERARRAGRGPPGGGRLAGDENEAVDAVEEERRRDQEDLDRQEQRDLLEPSGQARCRRRRRAARPCWCRGGGRGRRPPGRRPRPSEGGGRGCGAPPPSAGSLHLQDAEELPHGLGGLLERQRSPPASARSRRSAPRPRSRA